MMSCVLTTLLLLLMFGGTVSSYSSESCHYVADCLSIGEDNICLGGKVKYTQTSLDIVNSSTLRSQQDHLRMWESLQSVPRCWDVLYPLLCAVYMPKCEQSQLEMYRRDMCENVKRQCGIVEEIIDGGWPEFLECNQPYFSTGADCTAETYTGMSFNDNVSCSFPLTSTTNEASFYKSIDGCGEQCENAVYSQQELRYIYSFIGVFGFCTLLLTMLAAVTFLLDWKNSSKYPSIIIFYMNVCFWMGSIGWLAQYASKDAKASIVCRKDGTVRLKEPTTGEEKETAACTVIFFIVYYTMMAAIVWFGILCYSWHVKFKKLQSGSMDDKLKKKIAYFHIAAWAVPLICAIIALSLKKVDGEFLTGICFISSSDKLATTFLVLLPAAVSFCVGICFLIEGIIRLYKLRTTDDGVRNKKITSTMIRLGVFSALVAIFLVLTISAHIYTYSYKDLWERSFRNFTLCHIKSRFSSEPVECQVSDRPSLVVTYFNILAYFGSGILMSSWTWTAASRDTWKRFFRKILRMPTNKPVKLKSRHRMIALAFQQKQQKKTGRKISLDFHTSHDDPLGMKMDVGSVTSQELSSAWMEAMPKLVARRGGVALPVAGTLRRYSDSDISSMIASRRASLDSQLSEAEKSSKVAKKRYTRGRKRSKGLNPADIAAFQAKMKGETSRPSADNREDGLSRHQSSDDFKAHFRRKISNASTSLGSDASAHNISLDCGESYDLASKRSSLDSTVHAGLTNTAHLEQLTLATYSMFTSNSSTPHESRHKVSRKSRDKACSSATSSKCKDGKSRSVQTPNSGYINGALDGTDDDLSDISI